MLAPKAATQNDATADRGGVASLVPVLPVPPEVPGGEAEAAPADAAPFVIDRAAEAEKAGPVAAPPARKHPLPLGAVLRDRYELVSILGRGGMSTVYGAVDRLRLRAGSSEPTVALKILNTDPDIGADMVELLHREARRMQEFVHPNIVRVYDWDQDGAISFIIMERLVGRTLGSVLRERAGEPLGRRPIRQIVEGVGSALAYAHGLGVVHADLKPGNVFLTADGGVKVLDFGFAHRHDPEAGGGGEEPTIVLFDRVGALTPAYAAIDLLEGRPATPLDDVYSLGVLAYMLCAGTHPFAQKSARAARRANLVPERPPGLSGARWRALEAALAFERRERPESVVAFVAAFTAPSLVDRLLGRG